MPHEPLILFSGSSNPSLAGHIAQLLGSRLGRCVTGRHPDGEVNIRIDESVRGRQVVLIQSLSPPVDENLVELLAMADACRRASASRLIAVIPYFGYARSDKRSGRRAPVGASMVASLLQNVGIGHIVTIDLHAAQIEGFFHVPVDSLTSAPTMAHILKDRLPRDLVVVSPDEGRFKMAVEFGRRLNAPVVVMHKERLDGVSTAVAEVVGHVAGRPCLIIDDIISTGGTMAAALEVLLREGARPEIYVAATHGLFVGGGRVKLNHPSVRAIYVTDTIAGMNQLRPPVNVVLMGPLLAAAVRRLESDESLGDLSARVIHSGGEPLSVNSGGT
jgi:ribose-phosphate pyrophosphokinase